jgi:autotransporter translocation and assembly factor TamB
VRIAHALASGVGLGVTFVLAALGALVGHLDSPQGRRALARLVGDQATASLAGSIELRDLRHVGVHRLELGHATVLSPDGATVLAADDVSVEYDLLALARALLGSGAGFEIRSVHVRALRLWWIDDGRGEPTLARAFAPRRPDASPTPPAPSTFRLAVRDVSVGSLHVEATLGARSFAARAQLVSGAVVVEQAATHVRIGELHAVVAPIEGATHADTVVELRGDLDLLAHAPAARLRLAVRGLSARLQSGDTDALVEGAFDGASSRVDGRIAARTRRSELTRALGLPPMADGEASFGLVLAGPLRRLELAADVSAGGIAEARATGWIDGDAISTTEAMAEHAETPLADLRLALTEARAQAFARTAPPLAASAVMRVQVTGDASGIAVAIDADSSVRADRLATQEARAGRGAPAPDPIASNDAPPRSSPAAIDAALRLALHARVTRARDGAIMAAGAVGIELADARADVDFAIDQGAAARPGLAPARSRAFLRVRGVVPALAPLAALRLPIRGALDLDAGADVDFAGGTFAMSGTLGVRQLVASAATIPSALVHVRAGGPFATPRFDADVAAAAVQLAGDERGAGESLHDVFVRATGSPEEFLLTTSLHTSRAQRLALAGTIDRGRPGLHAHGIQGTLARGAFRAELGVQELALRDGAVAITGLRLASTAGGLRFDGAIDRAHHRYDVDLASTPLDLAQLADGLAIELHGARGFVTVRATSQSLSAGSRVDLPLVPADDRGTLRVDLDAPRAVTARALRAPRAGGDPRLTGRIRLELTDAWAPEVGAVDGQVDLVLDDRLIEGGARVAIRELVDADLRVGGALAGTLDDFDRALRATIGHVDLDLRALDLERLQSFLARHGQASATKLGGLVAIGGRLTREAEGAPPEGALWAAIIGLSLVSGATVLEGVDVGGTVSMTREATQAGEGERVQLGLDVRTVDRHGPLASLSVAVSAGWPEVQALARGDAPVDRKRLLGQPFRATLSVPRRKAGELPAFLRRELPLDGSLSAELRLDGTLLAPSLRLDATIADVKAPDGALQSLDLHATYDGKRARTHVEIGPSGRAATPSFLADAEVVIDAAAIVAGSRGPTPSRADWTASVDAKLQRLPLGMFAELAPGLASGSLSGEVHLAGLHDLRAGAPTLKGTFAVDDLVLGADRFEQAILDFHADRAGAGAKVALRGPAGFVDLAVDAPLRWERALVPALLPGGTVTTTMTTKGLRLKPFEALVAPLDELDGRLDVDLRGSLHVGAASSGGHAAGPLPPDALELEGTIRLADGTVLVGAIGERWQHVGIDVVLGRSKIELKKLHLEADGGRADASGSVTLAGTSPRSLHFEIETDRLPFSNDGVPVGDLSGKVVLEGDLRDPALAKLDVTISPMTVELAPTSEKRPQELAEDASIVVLQPMRKPTPIASTTSVRAPLRVTVHLPQNVWVRREDLLLAVRGSPTLGIGRVATVAGELSVDRGWVQVLGKRFVLDHGTVRFDGATELNPTLDLAVKWDAPDGSKVTITITGRLRAPKITLSSDPAGTPAEIMSLLALGRRDAGSAAKQAQAEQGAATQTSALVQGFTGALLGKQLQKILPTGVSLNLQPGSQGLGDVKIGGGYQLQNVYFEIGYQAGARQPSGTSTQAPPRTTFGIEWRFKPTWSLLTTLGDTGSAAVDLLWNYRY